MAFMDLYTTMLASFSAKVKVFKPVSYARLRRADYTVYILRSTSASGGYSLYHPRRPVSSARKNVQRQQHRIQAGNPRIDWPQMGDCPPYLFKTYMKTNYFLWRTTDNQHLTASTKL